MQSHARVVVIGGGVMGVSLLYHLAKLGWRDAVLLEKNELTAGSTWHAAGLCTHFAHNLTIMQMRAHSVKLYSGILEAETEQPVSFHQCGALRITREQDRMDEFRHVQGIGRYAGFDFNILTPNELKAIYPLCETGGLLGAIHEPYDGYVDPSQATQAMAAGARAGGAEIIRHCPVQSIKQKPGGEWLIHTPRGEITAEHIVNAAGTWCREIGTMMGVDLPVVPMLHQYLVTDRVEAVATRDQELHQELPIIRDPEESWYVRQERDGFIVGPYEKAAHPWAIDGVPPEFGMELLPPELDRIEDIVALAMARVPALSEAGIKTIVNGPITFTPDANPLIGPAFGLQNAWLLTGSSMGVMEGGGAGKFLAEWIVGGEPPMDALVLDPRRFGSYADRTYRVEKAIETFGNQFAIHYPFEERPAGRPAITSPIHELLASQGSQFGTAYGWERPNWFLGNIEGGAPALSFKRCNWFDAVAEECRGASERVALADLSAFSKFEVYGGDAMRFMASLGANHPPRNLERIGLTHALTDSGGVLSEFTVMRLAEERFYLTSAAASGRQDLELLQNHAKRFPGVSIRERTYEKGILGVMGPQSQMLLQSLSDADLGHQTFPWLSAKEISIAGISVLAARVSYIGEAGFELHHALEDQMQLYEHLAAAGKSLGMCHYGAYAMNAMRLEKGYRAWGMDLSSERTPLEAGLRRLVSLKDRDFVGRERLIEQQNGHLPFQMELLELEGLRDQDPFALHPVFANGEVAGLITSGSYGHRVGKSLALAYLKPTALSPECSLTAEILSNRARATILSSAPYDPENRKLKLGPEA